MSRKIMIVGPSIKMGGIERASCTIANELSSLGYAVVYLAIFKHDHFFQLHPSVTYDEPLDGTNVRRLSLFATIKRIRRTVHAHEPDGILVFNKFYAAIATLALLFTKYGIVVSERSSPFFTWRFKLKIINRIAFTLKKPKGVLAQTHIAASFQVKYYGADVPVCVVPNAVRQTALVSPLERKNYVLAVGRIDDYLKGFERLLDVMVLVDSEWDLVFAGGSHDPKLVRKIETLNLGRRVRFLGAVKNLDPIYAEAGIFVMPSLSEGFPNALCEAMAAGVPCVSFDFVAGPRDLIEHERNGILIRNGDIAGMASAINQLIRNPQLREQLGKAAVEVRERLRGDLIAARVAKFIFDPLV